MTNRTFGHIFENSATELPMGADGSYFSVDLSVLKEAPETIALVLNRIPKDTFHLAQFIADSQTMDIIQDKLPGWYEKLRIHAERDQLRD